MSTIPYKIVTPRGVKYNGYTNISENDVIEYFGIPYDIQTFNYQGLCQYYETNIVDFVRDIILEGNTNMLVKSIHYSNTDRVLSFWLTNTCEKVWIVKFDCFIPHLMNVLKEDFLKQE
jgi:hypothetical protein